LLLGFTRFWSVLLGFGQTGPASPVSSFSFQVSGLRLPPCAIPTLSGKSHYTRYNVDYQVLSPLHEPLQTLLCSRYIFTLDEMIL
jgi:hypothetical protein